MVLLVDSTNAKNFLPFSLVCSRAIPINMLKNTRFEMFVPLMYLNEISLFSTGTKKGSVIFYTAISEHS